MPVLTGSVHASILPKPSRAGFSLSRSELIEPGVATCGFRGMAGPCLESLEHTYQVQVPVYYEITVCFCSGKILASEESASFTGRPTECVPLSNGSLRHAASDSTAVKPALLMEGRRGYAVDMVVVAPGMSSAVVGRVLGNRNV